MLKLSAVGSIYKYFLPQLLNHFSQSRNVFCLKTPPSPPVEHPREGKTGTGERGRQGDNAPQRRDIGPMACRMRWWVRTEPSGISMAIEMAVAIALSKN